jgi:hypothetical protein
MDMYVFYFYLFFLIQMDQEAMSVLTILIFYNMFFIISLDMQSFAFVHCIFSKQQHLGILCTIINNSSRSQIW